MPTQLSPQIPHLRTTTSVPRRIGLVSTYPPMLCGLATFAVALETELRRTGHRIDIIRVDDGTSPLPTSAVAATLVHRDPTSMRAVAAVLSQTDVAIIQHEYGIFGGTDGDEVLDLLRSLDVATIVVLHTVPARPSSHQRTVLEEIVQLADASIVMSNAARKRLIEHYAVDPSKVTMIPHGAALPIDSPSPVPAEGSRPSVLTWGLLGPGKGIEHAIDAMALLGDVRPRPRYTVAGVTHPKVFSMHGDAYRHSLVQRTWSTGVAGSVVFDDTYRDLPTLTRFIAGASIVVLPYDSRDQATSGVLVDAVAAGRPVVATAFPHAVELLGSGAGIVVPHGDPRALADALGTMLADPQLLQAMGDEARRIAPSLSWASVARRYLRLADRVTLDGLDRVAM